MIGQRFMEGIADEPADREVDLCFVHQAPILDDPEKKPGEHQAHRDFGIDTGSTLVGW